MTAALTPPLALAYLHELSADIRAAIVLDAAGNRLAGPDSLAAPARALLAEAPVVRVLTDRGGAFAARDGRHGVVVATGTLALPRLVLHDLARVLAALGEEAPAAPGEDAAADPAAPDREATAAPGEDAAADPAALGRDATTPPGEDAPADPAALRGHAPADPAALQADAPRVVAGLPDGPSEGLPSGAARAAAEALLNAL